jgi:hypothetical protein
LERNLVVVGVGGVGGVTSVDRVAELIGEAVSTAVRRAVEEIDLTDPAEPEIGDPDADDPYAVFGLPRSASWEEILVTRKRLARAWHPDAGGSESALRSLNAAFAELRVRRGR